jgi:hypothetical protein
MHSDAAQIERRCDADTHFFFFFITLGLELGDTKVYEP